LKEDEEFIDRDFGSNSDEKDDQGNKNSLYWTGSPPEDSPSTDNPI